MDQVPEPIVKAIQEGDAKQQPQIDDNTAKLGVKGLVTTPAGILAIIAALVTAFTTVWPMIRTPVDPNVVQKVQVMNWPKTDAPLTDAQKKVIDDFKALQDTMKKP